MYLEQRMVTRETCPCKDRPTPLFSSENSRTFRVPLEEIMNCDQSNILAFFSVSWNSKKEILFICWSFLHADNGETPCALVSVIQISA